MAAVPSSLEAMPPLSPVGLPETWDAESDVVIAGFGGAGAAAAWEALNAGATVTILEKQGKAGGSTNICGGLIYMGGGTPTQVAAGFNETTTINILLRQRDLA